MLLRVAGHGTVLLRPFQSVIEPGRILLQFGNSWSDVAYAWTQLLWALIVWSVFGTAITRMAILEFSGNRHPGVRESMTFAVRHLRSTFGAPLLPMGFIGMLWAICFLGGLVGAGSRRR